MCPFCCAAQIELSADRDPLPLDRFLMQLTKEFWMDCQRFWLALRDEYPLGDDGFTQGRARAIDLLLGMEATYSSYKYEAQAKILADAQSDLLHVLDMSSLIDRPNKYTVMATLEALGVALGVMQRPPPSRR